MQNSPLYFFRRIFVRGIIRRLRLRLCHDSCNVDQFQSNSHKTRLPTHNGEASRPTKTVENTNSRSEKKELFAVGSSFYPSIKPTIESFQDFGQVDLLIGHEGLDKEQNWTNSSDHAAFHAQKIPFIYFGVANLIQISYRT